jgi:hypothetical protein
MLGSVPRAEARCQVGGSPRVPGAQADALRSLPDAGRARTLTNRWTLTRCREERQDRRPDRRRVPGAGRVLRWNRRPRRARVDATKANRTRTRLYRADHRGFELLDYAEDSPPELAGHAVESWQRRRRDRRVAERVGFVPAGGVLGATLWPITGARAWCFQQRPPTGLAPPRLSASSTFNPAAAIRA